MNTYPEIIISILEDAKASNQSRVSLVDIIEQYDARNKLAPLLEEINDALKMINWVSTTKEGKEVFLNITNEQIAQVEIDDKDFSWADKEYRRRFSKAYKNMK